MATIDEVLHTRLTGQVSLVSNRIYAVRPPQNPTFPYVTYQRITEEPAEGMTASHGMTAPVFQVDCWSTASPTEARAVGAQVRAAMKRWSDEGTDPVVLDCFLRTSGDLPPDDDEPRNEAGVFRFSADYEVWHRE